MTATAGDIRVGVYDSLGAKNIAAGLQGIPGIRVQAITDMEAETLFRYDVVALGSVKGLPYDSWHDAIELYVRSGGGLLLCHDATGFRGWNTPLFPKVCGGMDRSEQKKMRGAVSQHPLTQGLPDTFDQTYSDHIILNCGENGTILIKDEDGKAVVVAGTVEFGRVVGCGLLPGFTDAPDGKPADRAPVGAERELLVKTVRWLGEEPLTQRPAAEMTARRQKISAAIALRRAAEVAVSDAAGGGSGPRGKDWFTDAMLNEQGYVHPPVAQAPGRFFMFDGDFVAIGSRQEVGREYGEIVGILKQLKWLGVTDIITHSGGPQSSIRYLSQMTNAVYSSKAKQYGFDYLDTLLKACHETGLNVWGFWHAGYTGDYPIRDAQGKPYGDYVDIKNPAFLDQCRRCIDELAARYTTYGNFKGIFLDEFWHPFVFDRMEGQVDDFIAFCRKTYDETPPATLDLKACFARGAEWCEPENVWWRRYALYRSTFAVTFFRDVTAYANAKGLQTMPQVGFGFPWFQGHANTYELLRAGNLPWSYENRNNSRYEQYPGDKIIYATHSCTAGGYQMISMINGHYGSQFAFESSWLPLGYGKNPRVLEILAREIRANREWYGAKPLTPYALLVNRSAMDLTFKQASRVFDETATAVQMALRTAYPTAMLMVQDAEYFSRYPALIAAKHSLAFMPERSYQALLRYVENGGCLVLLDGQATTSRDDHTEIKDHYAGLTGVTRPPSAAGAAGNTVAGALRFVAGATNALNWTFPALSVAEATPSRPDARVLAVNANDNRPLITELPRGKGRVVALHFDITPLLTAGESAASAVRLLGATLEPFARSPIRVEGDLQIFSVLKQNNWVVVTLIGPGSDYAKAAANYPARGAVFVDMRALGVDSKRFKVLSLARDREMMPQGKHWDFFARTYWNADMLAKDGVSVYLAADSMANTPLNSKITDEYVRKWVLPRWNESSACRAYEHEIIAVAPAGEASMLDGLPARP